MAKNPAFELQEAGTAVWLDQLSREIIQSGELASFIKDAAMTGVTSNPAIFHSAMTKGTAYDEQLGDLVDTDLNTEEIYEELAVEDIQLACDVLRPVYDERMGTDGFVSLEVSPHLARDTEGTYNAAQRLHGMVERPNVMIKIPGTPEGVPAIRQCLEIGIPINVTLLFSLEAYEDVARTYVDAMTARAARGLEPNIPSVASFFVSRIDSLVDKLLNERAEATSGEERELALSLRGQAAIHNARLAYQSYLEIFNTEQWAAIAQQGGLAQRPLWASTSTKNPEYRDTIYVETLVGRNTVNTMPGETLKALLDHGKIEPDTVMKDVDPARLYFGELEELGISFEDVTDQLLDEGIDKFIKPYDDLLAALEAKTAAIKA